MENKRKSKGVYSELDIIGLDGQPIPKKKEEADYVKDFLNWYNNVNKSTYSICDRREERQRERPDFICSDASAEWIAIEFTNLFDDPRVVARNMREAQKPNFNPLEPGAVVRTIFERNDVIEVVRRKDQKSFVNLPRELIWSKKMVVVNIDRYCTPEELVDSTLYGSSAKTHFENVTDVFLMWYQAGAPGQWTCCDVTERI